MGHVFVVRGDLRRLSCDAWLLPTDRQRHVVRRNWVDERSPLARHVDAQGFHTGPPPPGWDDGARAGKVDPWSPADGPQPWLVDVGGWRERSSAWLLDGVREFLAAAAHDLAGHPVRNGRAKPLVALPVVGTGAGGGADIKAELVRDLLRLLHEEAVERELDVAMVAHTAPMFSAAQAQRRTLADAWPALDPAVLGVLGELSAHARSGNLVLFLGAGVSAGAGLPSWDELLDWLASDEAADISESDRRALSRLPAPDRARIIVGRLRVNRAGLGERIAERFRSPHHSLAHGLLAALPVDEVVTTNYDTLFETASKAAGRPLTVVPSRASRARRWLLKLHGSVDAPETIVLTREDYLRYADQRQALAGIVQALLMTRHMLFVGFSLQDENFQRIVDDVRKVVRSADADTGDPFGTALLPAKEQLLQELWSDDLRCTDVAPHGGPAAYRELEIVLDRLLADSWANTGHLLDPDFEPVLPPADLRLRQLLVELERGITDEIRSSPAWPGVERLLDELGGKPRT